MITIQHNLQAVIDSLQRAPVKLIRAHVDAINDTAFEARVDLQEAMRQEFDRVTPYMVRSVWVAKATVENQTATVWPRYMGGKGVDPAKILLAQVRGGPRRNKRFEVALQRAGLLPQGMAAVPAGGLDPAHVDAYGNVKGSFIVQLLSYLKALDQRHGDKSNMSASGVAASRSAASRRVASRPSMAWRTS